MVMRDWLWTEAALRGPGLEVSLPIFGRHCMAKRKKVRPPHLAERFSFWSDGARCRRLRFA